MTKASDFGYGACLGLEAPRAYDGIPVHPTLSLLLVLFALLQISVLLPLLVVHTEEACNSGFKLPLRSWTKL